MELEGIPILADISGYLQAIESDERVEIARDQKLVFLLHYRPGHFLIKGRPLGKIVVDGPMNESMAQCLSTSGRICIFFPIKNFIPTIFFFNYPKYPGVRLLAEGILCFVHCRQGIRK